MKKRILFVINPVSGGKKKVGFPSLVKNNLDEKKFNCSFRFTEYAGHAAHLAKQAIEQDTDIVVAVGGDGTINEIASAVCGTSARMGIIPFGSGNGLARALHIPLNNKAAIKRLNNLHDECIDSGELNGHLFFNMAGIGFDAHISQRFSKLKGRGLPGYIKTTLSTIATYQSQQYNLLIDGHPIEREAFMISIANSSQFGNNAHVSPNASVNDGLLDICIIKPFPLYHFPVMGFHMFGKTADKSKYVEIIRGKEIRILREKAGPVHLDGEPLDMEKEINIVIKPLSLRILT